MTKITEQRNKVSQNIDKSSILDILKIINKEDMLISLVVENHLKEIETVVNAVIKSFKIGGRLFYVGCGTSGRLGILDAAECPPTFGVSKEMVQGIIGGGNRAMFESIEGAEDIEKNAKKELIKRKINNKDTVIGISASGTAKFVLGAIKYAKSVNAFTSLITFNEIKNKQNVDQIISMNVGAEIIAGSTRMKAGTATKMILNMISTISMIKFNKTYKNIMVDLKISNNKLLVRGINIIVSLTKLSYKESAALLKKSKNNVKIAIVMNKLNLDYKTSKIFLNKNSDNLRDLLE